MSAAERVAHAAATIRARWERGVMTDPQTEAAQALEDCCQLLDPEVAAELARLRARVAELEESPLAWAEQLDAKTLDNFLIALGAATEYEPLDGAIAEIHGLIRSFRDAVEPSRAPELVAAEMEEGAPSQVVPVVDDVPVPVLLTEMDGPVPCATYARQAAAGVRRLIHPLDKGVRS